MSKFKDIIVKGTLRVIRKIVTSALEVDDLTITNKINDVPITQYVVDDTLNSKLSGINDSIDGNKTNIDNLINTYNDINNAVVNKVDKINGKGLSTEDFTTEYRELLKKSAIYDVSLQDYITYTDCTNPSSPNFNLNYRVSYPGSNIFVYRQGYRAICEQFDHKIDESGIITLLSGSGCVMLNAYRYSSNTYSCIYPPNLNLRYVIDPLTNVNFYNVRGATTDLYCIDLLNTRMMNTDYTLSINRMSNLYIYTVPNYLNINVWDASMVSIRPAYNNVHENYKPTYVNIAGVLASYIYGGTHIVGIGGSLLSLTLFPSTVLQHSVQLTHRDTINLRYFSIANGDSDIHIQPHGTNVPHNITVYNNIYLKYLKPNQLHYDCESDTDTFINVDPCDNNSYNVSITIPTGVCALINNVGMPLIKITTDLNLNNVSVENHKNGFNVRQCPININIYDRETETEYGISSCISNEKLSLNNIAALLVINGYNKYRYNSIDYTGVPDTYSAGLDLFNCYYSISGGVSKYNTIKYVNFKYGSYLHARNLTSLNVYSAYGDIRIPECHNVYIHNSNIKYLDIGGVDRLYIENSTANIQRVIHTSSVYENSGCINILMCDGAVTFEHTDPAYIGGTPHFDIHGLIQQSNNWIHSLKDHYVPRCKCFYTRDISIPLNTDDLVINRSGTYNIIIDGVNQISGHISCSDYLSYTRPIVNNYTTGYDLTVSSYSPYSLHGSQPNIIRINSPVISPIDMIRVNIPYGALNDNNAITLYPYSQVKVKNSQMNSYVPPSNISINTKLSYIDDRENISNQTIIIDNCNYGQSSIDIVNMNIHNMIYEGYPLSYSNISGDNIQFVNMTPYPNGNTRTSYNVNLYVQSDNNCTEKYLYINHMLLSNSTIIANNWPEYRSNLNISIEAPIYNTPIITHNNCNIHLIQKTQSNYNHCNIFNSSIYSGNIFIELIQPIDGYHVHQSTINSNVIICNLNINDEYPQTNTIIDASSDRISPTLSLVNLFAPSSSVPHWVIAQLSASNSDAYWIITGNNINCNIDISNTLTPMDNTMFANLFTNLPDLTNVQTKCILLNSTKLECLTDSDKAIATQKNWTLA